MAFLKVCYSNNMMKTDVKYLNSRTDLEDSFPLPFSPSNAGGNNRLQGTPNRANARPGAPEAERYVAKDRSSRLKYWNGSGEFLTFLKPRIARE
jgi:hypothetical protein